MGFSYILASQHLLLSVFLVLAIVVNRKCYFIETLLAFFFLIFIYLFMYVCMYLWLCWVFVSVRGLSLVAASGGHSSSRCAASRCGAQAPDAQAQQLWLTGLVAPWHVGSSQTTARTRVPCIGRQILNHCATREAPLLAF